MSGLYSVGINQAPIHPALPSDHAGVFQPSQNTPPISREVLIKRLDLGPLNSRQRYATTLATIIYTYGANEGVAAAVRHQGSSQSDVAYSAKPNVEELKKEWLAKKGTVVSFNDEIRAALISSLRPGYDAAADRIEDEVKTAAAKAKKTFPHDPGWAYDLFTKTMRNEIFLMANNTRLPPNVSDINQCRLTVKWEGGDPTVGLIAKTSHKFGT
jgi:hypothetical protein